MLQQMLLPLVISFLCSLLGTRGMIALPILDIPEGARSSHKTPTPTSGGVSVILSFMVFLYLSGASFTSNLIIILSGAFLIAAIGFIDEIKELSFKFRLLLQIIIATVVLSITLNPDLTFASFAYFMLLLFLLCGFMNAFNFIDGLNGMSGGAALVGAFFAGLYFQDQSVYYFALVPVLLGFLFFNVQGKIFLGDVGSLFLGSLLPTLLLLNPDVLTSSILVIGHLFFLYLFDLTVMMAYRLITGETVFTPHRGWFYFRLQAAGFSHLGVSGFYAGFTTFQGIFLLLIPMDTKLSFALLYLFDITFYSIVLYYINKYYRKKNPLKPLATNL